MIHLVNTSYTHVQVAGFLDLHRQWNVSHDGKTYESVRTENGKYSTPFFLAEMYSSIQRHKTESAGKPGFFYLPLQNTHSPLESPGGKYDKVSANICTSLSSACNRMIVHTFAVLMLLYIYIIYRAGPICGSRLFIKDNQIHLIFVLTFRRIINLSVSGLRAHSEPEPAHVLRHGSHRR